MFCMLFASICNARHKPNKCGEIMNYKHGEIYPVLNERKPNVPDDVTVELRTSTGVKWYKTEIGKIKVWKDSWSWLRIVDERYL